MNFHNIERSGFRCGEYVGFDATGARWRIIRDKCARYWRAVRQTPAIPGGFLAADTLRELSARLEVHRG